MMEGSTHQPAALAVIQAKLSVAHYRDGNWKKSVQVAKELEENTQWDGMTS